MEGEDAVDGRSSMPPKECAKFLTINILYSLTSILKVFCNINATSTPNLKL
jgi:hypothetical protein